MARSQSHRVAACGAGGTHSCIRPNTRTHHGYFQAHFLRTFYPDIDIQTELIRDEIAEDTRAARELGREDPLSGNMIAVSSFNASRKNMAYVVFPTGETNCQLSK